MSKILISGIRGQDGSFLSEFLLSEGHEIHGLVRRSASPEANTKLGKIANEIEFHYGDLRDYLSIYKIIDEVRPDEIYNLGAISNVTDSFTCPQLVLETNGNGFVNILEAVRNINKEIKIYQASTTELFGKTDELQSEITPMHPASPYAIGKYTAHTMGELYRNCYGMFICLGILGNHESERRGYEFVTRKITSSVARIYHKTQKELRLGNLTTKRDWGYAKEYVEWMYNMMQYSTPETFAIGTGESHSILEFVERSFEYVGLDYTTYVVYDKEFIRPKDEHDLRVNYSKAKEKLGFEPQVKFEELVDIMMEHDLRMEKKIDG